jgi:single-strand DNA-binding protein
MNVVILEGVLARPGEVRTLPSGDTLVAYEVTTRDGQGRASTVPVVWAGAAGGVLGGETAVVVTGSVRRRFFRAGGSTQSRTEVVAAAVVDAGDRRRARRAIDQAVAAARPG